MLQRAPIGALCIASHHDGTGLLLRCLVAWNPTAVDTDNYLNRFRCLTTRYD